MQMKKKIKVMLTQEIDEGNVKTGVDVLTDTSDEEIKNMFLDVFKGLVKTKILTLKDLLEHE
nr:MAG TPA: hypothetical protein [Caudoviricetes sp.]